MGDQKDVDKTRKDIAEQNQSNNHIVDNYNVHEQIQKQTDNNQKTQQQTALTQNYQHHQEQQQQESIQTNSSYNQNQVYQHHDNIQTGINQHYQSQNYQQNIQHQHDNIQTGSSQHHQSQNYQQHIESQNQMTTTMTYFQSSSSSQQHIQKSEQWTHQHGDSAFVTNNIVDQATNKVGKDNLEKMSYVASAKNKEKSKDIPIPEPKPAEVNQPDVSDTSSSSISSYEANYVNDSANVAHEKTGKSVNIAYREFASGVVHPSKFIFSKQQFFIWI